MFTVQSSVMFCVYGDSTNVIERSTKILQWNAEKWDDAFEHDIYLYVENNFIYSIFNAIESSCHCHTAFIFAYIYWKCNGHKVHTCLDYKYWNHFPFLFIFKWLHNEYVSSAYNSSKIRRSKWLLVLKNIHTEILYTK